MPFATNVYKLLFLLVAVLLCKVSTAQQPGFIHIQSESNEAYYVQWKGSTYNSSVTGYLVIPQVPAGEHTLVIAFPGKAFAEYAFSCTISDKSRGFSLKQGIDNSLSLFDMVNFMVNRGSTPTKEQLVEVMAKQPEPLKGEKTMNQATVGKVGDTANYNTRLATLSRIRKIFDKPSPGGIDQVYIIFNGTKADTIALFIQALEEPLKQSAATGKPSQKGKGEPLATDMGVALIPQMLRQNLFSK